MDDVAATGTSDVAGVLRSQAALDAPGDLGAELGIRGRVRALLPLLLRLALDPRAHAVVVTPLLLLPAIMQQEEWKNTQHELFFQFAFAAAGILIGLRALARLLKFRYPLDFRPYCAPLAISLGVAVAGFLYLLSSATIDGVKTMWDGWQFHQMGISFAATGQFIVDGLPSHHSPPLYPMYLAVFYRLDSSLVTIKLAVGIMYFLCLAAIVLASRRLYGLEWGLLAALLVTSVAPWAFTTSRNYAEPLVLLTFTLALYAVMRSLEPGRRRWIVMAGLFAGLVYLAKSSLGPFFFLAVAMVLVWRARYTGRRGLKDRWYVLAGLVALGVMLPWVARNVSLFWDGTTGGLLTAWQTSQWFYSDLEYAFVRHPEKFLAALPTVAALGALFLALYASLMWPHLRASYAHLGSERIGVLWMAIVIPVAISILIATVIYIDEIRFIKDYHEMNIRAFYHTSRYLTLVLVPMVWAAAEAAAAGTATDAGADQAAARDSGKRKAIGPGPTQPGVEVVQKAGPA